MVEPAAQTPGTVNPQQFFPVGGQIPGMFANHIMVATDGVSVYLTFSQAMPIMQPSVGPQKLENVPLFALPVAKVVLAPKVLPELIKNLEELKRQIEQHQSS